MKQKLLGVERAVARAAGNDIRGRAWLGALGLLLLAAAFSFAAAASPYTGSAIALPTTFQAENFDRGGEGVGYHDLTAANTGGQYHRRCAIRTRASPAR